MENFDLEKVYDEKIAPLMTQIIAICKEHKMPFAAQFMYANDEDEGEQYCTSFADHKKERGQSDHMKELFEVIRPPRPAPALNMTVKDGNGNITQMIRVIG